jgi:hypothetical protein
VSNEGIFAVCPFCQATRLATADGRPGQCFNPQCGLRSIKLEDPVAGVLEAIYQKCHLTLVSGLPGDDPLRSVLSHSMVGVVSADLNLLWVPHVDDANQRLQLATQAPTGRGRPTKAQQEAIATAQHHIDRLNKYAKACESAFKDAEGSRVWFWTDDRHQIVKVTVTAPNGEERAVGSGGLFNHGLFAPGQPPRGTEALRGRLLVVHRPEDVLAIQAEGAKRAREEDLPSERGYLWCAAIGDSTSAPLVRKLTRKPILFQRDNPVGYQITNAVRDLANLHVFHPPPGGLDVAEWLQQVQGDAWESLVKRFNERKLLTRPFGKVREEIDGLRRAEPEDLKKFEVDRWASERIVSDLRERGTLYFDGQVAYVFLHDSQYVIPVDLDDDGWRQLANKYGIAPTDALAKPLAVNITLTASEIGTKATVYPFAHYDEERQAVYMFNFDRTVYRITTDAIEPVANGTDAKLFVRNTKWLPFELALNNTLEKPLHIDRLVGDIQFATGHLDRSEVEHLFRLFALALFFPELFPTRPILAMIGPKGSGKTSSLELLGALLFGPEFRVADITGDPRDFDAALTSEFFVVADNADREIKWLQDKLAIVATGGTIKRRSYYTTNRLVEFKLKAWLAITSRTPHFRREDVADRLLPIHVERFSGFTAMADLKADIVKDRNLLMTAMVHDVQKALRGLTRHRRERMVTSYRMADFGQFALKVSGALGFGGDVADVLRRLGLEQQTFAMQNEPLFEFLDQWLAKKDNDGRELTTGTLYLELHQMGLESSPPRLTPWQSAQEFGRKLDDYQSTLETVYGMTARPGRSGAKLVRLYLPKNIDQAEPASDDQAA